MTAGARFGAELHRDGVTFRLWAPAARRVELMLDRAHPMPVLAEGWFETTIASLGAGARYKYRIDGEIEVPDPASHFQPQDVNGPSEVVEHGRFEWRTRDWRGRPWQDAVILELGANDALRGLDPKVTKVALDAILRKLADRRIVVLLAGMQAPRNLGPDYTRDFDSIYPSLASTHPVVFYPFFLEGVAADPKLNQADGLHPNAAGVDTIVTRILPQVEELIVKARAARAS